MELFIPGLVIILVVAVFIFLVLPRIGPMVLAIICLVALIVVGFQHYSMFSGEYRLSTWQYGLASYTPYVVLGIALIVIISSGFYMFGSTSVKSRIANTVSTPMEVIQNAVANAVEIMPAASSATNPITAGINRTINANVGTGRSNLGLGVPSAPANASASASAAPNTKSPNLPGVGFRASEV
jgi:hypothetical protein